MRLLLWHCEGSVAEGVKSQSRVLHGVSHRENSPKTYSVLLGVQQTMVNTTAGERLG